MKLSPNINTPGRVIRFLFALLLLGLAYWRGSWILLAAAAFVFFESLMSWCVVYQILGKNSCPIKKK